MTTVDERFARATEITRAALAEIGYDTRTADELGRTASRPDTLYTRRSQALPCPVLRRAAELGAEVVGFEMEDYDTWHGKRVERGACDCPLGEPSAGNGGGTR